mmetsp:Transcript_5992/g.9982  ORF Transcript_5992/g.9982 Transcript_5992/m.9982 type:complete len:1029 (-) Transcript_5992:151-3237(-)
MRRQHRTAFLLACLACASQGRRVQTSTEQLHASTAAFNPSSSGAHLHRGSPTHAASRAPKSVHMQGSFAALAEEKPDAKIIDTLGRRGYDYEVEISNEWYNNKDNEKLLKKYQQRVEKINALEDDIEELSDEQLIAKTAEFRKRLLAGESEDDILEEAFAVVREAAWRTLELRHYDVQLVGGMALHEGNLAQMGTGEGKTLVATCAVYLNALRGKGAFLVTVNDYLARRDAEQMGQVYTFLGLKVGLIQAEMKPAERQKAYQADVTYVTNQELGFDYLRDHLAMNSDEIVLPTTLNYCVVDEGDSVLVDEARIPLIISDKEDAEVDVQRMTQCKLLAEKMLRDEHYTVLEKELQVELTEKGQTFCEIALQSKNVFDPMMPWAKYLNNALRAKEIYIKNKQYVVRGDEVQIVDEFSGRVLEGRRWANGLHMAMEAKEGVTIQQETKAVATITYQSLFRRFEKLASMTGTALTEAQEFAQVYNLKVVNIPPALERQRIDIPNSVYKNVRGKSNAALNELIGMHKSGRPVLVGTVTIEATNTFSEKLTQIGIKHEVINADPENVEREAEIVAQAGRKGAVTIATNMAGRGTDILLGGSPSKMAELRVREALAAASGVRVPPVADDFYPVELDEEALELIDAAAAKYAEAAKVAVAERLKKVQARAATLNPGAQEKFLMDCQTEEKALALLHLEECLAIAASSADVYEETAEDLTREAFETVKATYKEALAEEREEVLNAGGLHIIGTNLHDSRRVDDQLRGRAGRQGDPGSSHFFISLEDRIFRQFGADKIKPVLDAFKIPEGAPLESEKVTQVVKDVQNAVENYFYTIRKGIFDFDEVLAIQRETTYSRREKVLQADVDYMLEEMKGYTEDLVKDFTGYCWKVKEKEPADEATAKDCHEKFLAAFVKMDITPEDLLGLSKEEVIKKASESGLRRLDEHYKYLDSYKDTLGYHSARWLSLQGIDMLWKKHMQAMDYVRDFAGMKAFSAENPVTAYRKEGFNLYEQFAERYRFQALSSFYRYDPFETNMGPR